MTYKDQLLKLAKAGKPKPHWSNPLGNTLAQLQSASSTYYDPELYAELIKLAPHWAAHQYKLKVAANKERLLAIARSGEPRPASKSALGQAFYNYTYEPGNAYDAEFTTQMSAIVPHWYTPSGLADLTDAAVTRLAEQFDSLQLWSRSTGDAQRAYKAAKSNETLRQHPHIAKLLFGAKCRPIRCVETGEIFVTQRAAATAFACTRQLINAHIAGRVHSVRGHHFVQIDSQEAL